MDKRVKIAILGAAAAGTGVLSYLAYKHFFCARTMQLQVEEAHVAWITEMATKHTDGDIEKAMHLLLAHCIAVRTDTAATEKIFKEIRCNSCGGRKNKTSFQVTLTAAERSYLNAMVVTHSVRDGLDKAVRVIFEYAINDADLATIFPSA